MGATNVDPGTDSDGTRTESAWLSLNLEIGPRLNLIPYVQYVPGLYGMLGNEQSLDWAARPLDFGISHVVLCGYEYLVWSVLMRLRHSSCPWRLLCHQPCTSVAVPPSSVITLLSKYVARTVVALRLDSDVPTCSLAGDDIVNSEYTSRYGCVKIIVQGVEGTVLHKVV